MRWGVFLRAEPPSRAFAFDSYLAALDAEEAAAAEIFRRIPDTAGSRAIR
jgi:hypothetical protein